MRSTGTLGFFCVLAATAPACAEASPAKVHGARAVALLSEQVDWTGHDRGVVDAGRALKLSTDGGDAGWSLDFLSLRSLKDPALDCCTSIDHFSDNQAGVKAWHAVGDTDTVSFGAETGRTSRRTLSPLVFPAKTTAGYASAQLAWDHGGKWSLSTGWFRQGGWGGRRMDLDVMRMDNGEPAAASGMRAALRMNLGDAGNDAHSWLKLEVREGNRAVGPGMGMRHGSDVGLTLTSIF